MLRPGITDSPKNCSNSFLEHLLYARRCFKCFAGAHLSIPHSPAKKWVLRLFHFVDEETEAREVKSFTRSQRKVDPNQCRPADLGAPSQMERVTLVPPMPKGVSLTLSPSAWLLQEEKQSCWPRGPGAPFFMSCPCQAVLTRRACSGVGWGPHGSRGDTGAQCLPREVSWKSESLD